MRFRPAILDLNLTMNLVVADVRRLILLSRYYDSGLQHYHNIETRRLVGLTLAATRLNSE